MLHQLPGASDTAASFQFEAEGHTLGNALRHMIMKKYAKTLHWILDTLIALQS